MKFKKEVQGIIGTITTISFLLLATTIESDWTKEYLIFAGVNLVILIVGAILLRRLMIYEAVKDIYLNCWVVWEVHRNYRIDRQHTRTKKEANLWIQKTTK